MSTRERAVQVGRVGVEVNQRRARLRRHLRAGTMRPHAFIALPPWWLRTAEVRWIIGAVRRMGPATAERVYDRAGLTGVERLGELPIRSRKRLIEELDIWAENRGELREAWERSAA
jgi:hypothetical protein